MKRAAPIPTASSLQEYYPALARMVANTSLLPHPDVVATVGRAVFPAIRKSGRRTQHVVVDGVPVGMYDDNYTPTVALLWAHGLVARNRQGWSFAHIWSASDDLQAYTHLANLALIPESFASLTDKDGPLTGYLRWHAWSVYRWKPAGCAAPTMPPGYDGLTWRYLPALADPLGFIRQRINGLDNERLRVLRPIMQQQGLL